MFSFNKKPASKQEKKRDPSEYGIFGLDENLAEEDFDDGDEDDNDLEAELAAITSGNKNKSKPKRKSNVVAPEALDAMVAASLRDIGSDEEVSDDDDPDILSELAEIAGTEEEATVDRASPPKRQAAGDGNGVMGLIKSRIEMYTVAEGNAKKAGDTSKARRFNRGLKTLQDLLKQAEAGKAVDMNDVPPEVSTKVVGSTSKSSEEIVPAIPVRRAPEPPPSVSPPIFEPTSDQSSTETPLATASDPRLALLNERKNEYKAAALEAKKAGNNETALKFIKIVKQFDTVMQALQEGQEVDLSKMPPSPSVPNKSPLPPPVPPRSVRKETEPIQKEAEVPSVTLNQEEEQTEEEETLILASSVIEALHQRLEKYKSVEAAAKEEGNASKARRMGRIVKQYEDAIKLHKAGKPIPIDELPTPPGYGPIPMEGTAKPKPVPPPRPQPSGLSTDSTSPAVAGPSKEAKSTTKYDKQISILLERQKEFRQAAMEAKKAGEIEEAKEYLRTFKGLEKLIESAREGARIDLSTIPIPPSKRSSLEDSFTIVAEEDCTASDDTDLDLNTRLEEQLSKQLIMCRNTRDHHKEMGDVAGTNRFENLALSVQKDLDFVRLTHKKRLPVPKFHYEMKQFNIVKCNTDLTDNVVEVTVVRGINYNVPNPKDVDTFVKIEFPYPQDDPFKTRTGLVKDTDNPEYNHQESIEIHRNQRACQRIFKRQVLKCEIYSKGCWGAGCCCSCCERHSSHLFSSCFSGFFRSDTLIGTVAIKLQPLETQCEIHDSFPLMDGRKTVGGKLEVKIRVRNPIVTKQIEQINEKWLIIDTC